MSARWGRPLALGLALLASVEFAWLATGGSPIVMTDYDRANYMEAAARFLATGTPYIASEVAGPFNYTRTTFLHPPVALYLMVPFTWLPGIAWYLVPIAVVVWSTWSWRPALWAGVLIGLLLVWPRTPSTILNGNTDLWIAAFVALGLRYGWPAVLVAVKPSLAPLALVGIRQRSWWVAAVVLLVASLPFGSLWLDWLAVVWNAPGGLLYSAYSLPYTLIPLVAWQGRTRDERLLSSSVDHLPRNAPA